MFSLYCTPFIKRTQNNNKKKRIRSTYLKGGRHEVRWELSQTAARDRRGVAEIHKKHLSPQTCILSQVTFISIAINVIKIVIFLFVTVKLL